MPKQFKDKKPVSKPVAGSDQVYAFDTTLFRQYAGAYELEVQLRFVLSLQRKGHRYFAQASGQVEMFPYADFTFFSKVVQVSVDFHLGKEGMIERNAYVNRAL